VERGAWSVERGAWSVERGAWSVERGAWSVERGAWSVELGAGRLELGGWSWDLRRERLMLPGIALLWFHPLAWLLRRNHFAALEELGDRVAA